MIVVTPTAQRTLNHLISRYIGFRTPQEYGISGFQWWYYQVRYHILSLDTDSGVYNVGQTYRMQYWGEIEYNQMKTGQGLLTYITDFKFNLRNLNYWVTRHELPGTSPSPTTRTPLPLGVKPIHCKGIGYNVYLCQYNDNTYRLTIKGKNITIPFKFDKYISPFRSRKDGQYAIFSLNGQYIKLTKEYVDQVISEAFKKNESRHHNKQIIRLTESDLHQMILETVTQILGEHSFMNGVGKPSIRHTLN